MKNTASSTPRRILAVATAVVSVPLIFALSAPASAATSDLGTESVKTGTQQTQVLASANWCRFFCF